MTIKQAIDDVANRSVSFREAEVFLARVLSCDRTFLHAHPETELTEAQAAAYETCLQQREANEPVAYITGVKEFYGRPFKCDARALIPRPETEALIDSAIAFLKDKPEASILELGTGCGNIAITLAKELPEVQIIATDVSSEALELAQENAAALAATVTFLTADLFDNPAISGPYDLIIANLPYVPDRWRMDPQAQPEVVFKEPAIALFGGEDGLDIYRRFFAEVPHFLTPTGHLLIEFNEDQGQAIADLAQKAFPDRQVKVTQDYAGLDRCLEVGSKE